MHNQTVAYAPLLIQLHVDGVVYEFEVEDNEENARWAEYEDKQAALAHFVRTTLRAFR